MYTLDLVISLFREFSLFCENFFLEEKNWKKKCFFGKRFVFLTLKMYTLDLSISLFREFSLFCEIFFLEEKNWKKKCFFSKRNYYFWNVHTLDSVISLFHWTFIILWKFLSWKKNWIKNCFFSKRNFLLLKYPHTWFSDFFVSWIFIILWKKILQERKKLKKNVFLQQKEKNHLKKTILTKVYIPIFSFYKWGTGKQLTLNLNVVNNNITPKISIISLLKKKKKLQLYIRTRYLKFENHGYQHLEPPWYPPGVWHRF
jgi:hypothetical protein